MKTREEQVAFLAGHFRYSTMNSWNGQSSYAANVKLRNLRIPKALKDRAYEALEVEETYDGVNQVLREFAEAHDWRYQIGFNGRSGGYLVLYQGGRRLSEYKSYCTRCGQRNFTTTEATGKKCGACGRATRVNRVFYETFTTGAGLGSRDPHDYADLSDADLLKEVRLVREFDKAVEQARRAFIETVRGSRVVEESYTVQKTRKVLRAR